MTKRVLLSILIIVFVIISLVGVYSFGLNNSKKITTSSNTTVELIDFDDVHYVDSFDVSDFSGKEINTIDIPSLEFSNLVVNGSDFTISDELMSRIKDNINSFGVATSFYILSLDDGMSFGYNIDGHFETASSIKAPYALYVYREIANGNIDPDQKIEYKERFHNAGTGVVKDSPFGTEFTVRDLVYYSVNDSDNVAHIMLHGTFGVTGYNNMLKRLGAKQLYLTATNPWTFTSCRSAAIIWQDIYNFALEDPEGVTFLNILSNGKYNYYKEIMPELPSASKTGFAHKDVVETGIVFDKHPYIAIAMANKGGSRGAYTQILNLIGLMNDVMQEYYTYLGE